MINMKIKFSSAERQIQSSHSARGRIKNQSHVRHFSQDQRATSSCSYRHINNVEEELSHAYNGQVSEFVERTIKNLNRKHNENVPKKNIYMNPIFSIQGTKIMKSIPKTLRQMKICGLAQLSSRNKRILPEPYFLNARQRINRMSERKKEMIQNFQKVKKFISLKQKQKRLKKTFHKGETSQQLTKNNWLEIWEQNKAKQHERYQIRLSQRHSKMSLDFQY